MRWQDFADLCYDLIKSEYPKAKRLAPVEDGGADFFIGDLSKHPRIFQSKYYPHRIYRGKIEKSLECAVKNYSPKEWILCIPKDLTGPQRKWFESVKEKYSNIKMDCWGEAELIRLLRKHEDVRRHYFDTTEVSFVEERRKRLRQGELVVNDLKSWMRKTTFSNIRYDWVKAESINHIDPQLGYKNEDIRILKKYRTYTYWIKGIQNSNALVKQGIVLIEQFHSLIDEKLESIDLKKLKDRWKPLSKHSCSIPRTREAIFKEVCGEHYTLEIRDMQGNLVAIIGDKKAELSIGYLYHGGDKLAWGELNILCCLKGKVEDLIKNKKLRENIKTYADIKRKLDSRQPFAEFQRKVKKIIADFNWYQKFKA